MKNIFLFILGIILISSCGDEVKMQNAYTIKTELNEYLNINNCYYYKIKVGNHDVYQYKYSTYYGTGSDIIHFEDMCNYCKEKNGK